MAKVTVVDYGMGNLLSVCRALTRCGAQEVELTGDPACVIRAERLVLPGVGAFATGMRRLHEGGLSEAVIGFARSSRPLLGICLGMQMLFNQSEEFGIHRGLGLIPGRVRHINHVSPELPAVRTPHIGWNALLAGPSIGDWSGTILETTALGEHVYFVHSFVVQPEDDHDVLSVCDYGGKQLTAVIGRGFVFGCQFHPEKSGPAGLAILKRFLAMGELAGVRG